MSTKFIFYYSNNIFNIRIFFYFYKIKVKIYLYYQKYYWKMFNILVDLINLRRKHNFSLTIKIKYFFFLRFVLILTSFIKSLNFLNDAFSEFT